MSQQAPEERRLFLVDGTALAYRSHFAFIRSPLTNSKGRNVSAVYGYTNALLRILEKERPPFAAVAFDTPEPTFRHARYNAYKATRDKTPEELVEQLPDIRSVTEGLGLAVIEVPGWEADDVLGALAVRGAREGMEVFLVTGDKDFMQLVSDRIRLYNLTRPDADVTIQGPDEVKDKFGVDPCRVVDILALMGDASDNIPGVPGVGEKTARRLIGEFGSLDRLYENLNKVKGKALRERLEEHRDLAFLSRDLVLLDLEVPLPLSPRELRVGPRKNELLRRVFLDLEFSSLLQRVAGKGERGEGERRYILVDQEETYREFLRALRTAPWLVIDLETTSIDPLQAEIVGIALAFKPGEAWYLPANLSPPVFGRPGGDLARFLEDLRPVLSDPAVAVCGQNIKYDLEVLHRAGVRNVQRVAFDTMVAHYLLHPGEMRHNLDYLSLKYLNVKKIPTSEIIGKGKGQISMWDAPVEKVCAYACEDADMTFRLKERLEPELEAEGLADLFRRIEMPLVRVLEHMELHGVRVDVEQLKAMSRELENKMEVLSERIYEMAGLRFNINSTQQLGKVLFERLALHKELGIQKVRRTKTGYATDASVLESMSAHPLPRTLLEYRQMQKLRSTYLDALPRLINEETGRIHASFNQTVTATGRLSSSDPNLQNIPVRTEMGRRIRAAFVPRDANAVLLSADYSQIELRILAHVSGDPMLRRVFREGGDVHRDTAALIFGVATGEVTPEMRAQAKTINFGIIYGMGPQRLSREAGISRTEAQAFIRSYFEVFHGVKSWIDRTLEEARETGYVTTLLGRKRRIDEINSENAQMRSMAENVAVNTPIQGTAADLIKKAMIDIHQELEVRKLASAMILQVHDELVFDVPGEELETMETLVRERMEGALELEVPIRVQTGWGRNWLEAH